MNAFPAGFKLGSEKNRTEVTVKKCGSLEIESGIEGLALLKTTKVISLILCFHQKPSALLNSLQRFSA